MLLQNLQAEIQKLLLNGSAIYLIFDTLNETFSPSLIQTRSNELYNL